MSKTILIIVALLSVNCYAGRIEPISEGEPAEYSGFLIDHAQEVKFRTINEENKLLRKKTISLEQLALIQGERAKYLNEMYVDAMAQYRDKESRSFWQKTVYFIGGVLITGAISYTAIKYTR